MINSNTARFDDRALTLKGCFQSANMLKAWDKSVLPGLRTQNILDLHDYYDFNRNKIAKIEVIIKQVTSGNYRPKAPIVTRLEKKHGIARHLPIPSPEDALVLQTISDYLSVSVSKYQPSDRAYFTRSHGFTREENVDESFPYSWSELWPAFQKRIYSFTSTFKYVVVTDITNYYDNISLDKLRNMLSGMGHFDEALFDLLFYVLESFLWRPDYAPLSGIGLPQLNFDAPRLLAHCFLFDVDKFLHKKTSGNFVRWMDDIDFGVNSTQEAKSILKELDEILLAKGLRLNMGKTKILSSEQAKDYFLPDENRWINVMTRRIDAFRIAKKPITGEKTKIKHRFRKFLAKPQVGRWAKVYARFFTLSQLIGDNFLEKYTPQLLISDPSIRESIFRFYLALGYSKKRLDSLVAFYKCEDCNDEYTIFALIKVFIGWQIRIGSKARGELVKLANDTLHISKANFVSALWILAKYGTVVDLYNAVIGHKDKWVYSSFVSRQVASILPRIRNVKTAYVLVRTIIMESGHLDALSIIYHNDSLRTAVPAASREIYYFVNGLTENSKFLLQKIIMIENILTNSKLDHAKRIAFKVKVLTKIKDPIYYEIVDSSV